MTNDWFTAEQHAQRAQEYFESGQWVRALNELRRAIEINPYEGEWHVGMGLTLHALQRHDEAVACFDRALDLRGDDVQIMLHMAVDLIHNKQLHRAIDVLDRAGEIEPQLEAVYCHRISAYAMLGEHDQAELMFYSARQLTDECPVCFDNIAQSLLTRGKVDRAIWCWQQTLRLEPHYPNVLASLGRAHQAKGQFDKARSCYLRHLRQHSDDVQVLLRLGRLLDQMGRTSEAVDRLRHVLDRDPSIAEAHVYLGDIAWRAGHGDAALVQYQTARRLDPTRPGVHLKLAAVAHKRHQYARTRKLLYDELQLTGRDAEQTLELARLLIEMSMPELAVQQLDPWVNREELRERLDKDVLATALLFRGVGMMLSDRVDQGVHDCRRSLRLKPGNMLAMQNLALAHLRLGQFRRAGSWLRRAMKIQPHDAYNRALKGRLQRAMLLDFSLRAVYRSLSLLHLIRPGVATGRARLAVNNPPSVEPAAANTVSQGSSPSSTAANVGP